MQRKNGIELLNYMCNIMHEKKRNILELLYKELGKEYLIIMFEKTLDIENNISGLYKHSVNENDQVQFKAEVAQIGDISEYARVLANIPIETKSTQKSLISYLNFLDMYKVGNISQLNILSRWS